MAWWAMVAVAAATVLMLAVVTMLAARRRGRVARVEERPTRISISLEIESDDPDDPRVQRLVTEAASRMFRLMPSLQEIEVRDRRGSLLATQMRTGPQHLVGQAPLNAYEPHTVRRPSTPSRWNDEPTPGETTARGSMRALASGWLRDVPEPSRRTLAERFDLSDAVRARIDDPDDALQLVTAILEGSGRGVRRERGMLWIGDVMVYVIRTPPGATVTAGALARAYSAFRASDATHGYVVVFGHVDPVDVRRRELLAPELVHLGADAVQRMADAAALGADPLRSARAPATSRPMVRPDPSAE